MDRRPRPASAVAAERDGESESTVPAHARDEHVVFSMRFAGLTGALSTVFTGGSRFSFVTVTTGRLTARHGPWALDTALSNIRSVSVTGPYRWFKVAGPAHLSLDDHGITFATNRDKGVFITFDEPVAAMEPTGRLQHPNLTVTVADPYALIRALVVAADLEVVTAI